MSDQPRERRSDHLRERHLSPGDIDRACGAVVASAVGDALGAGYEFAPPMGPDERAVMRVGRLTGGAPGTWTDDTELAMCVLGAITTGADLRERSTLHDVATAMRGWFATNPPDVGNTTRAALAAAGSAEGLAGAARAHYERTGQGAGNGSLMRTGPVALAYLRYESGPALDTAIAEAARAVSDLTHGDPLAGDACVLWSIAIDRAMREHRLDGVHDGLALLPSSRRSGWEDAIEEAAHRPMGDFSPNGYVRTALQAALAAIWQTPAEPLGARHLEEVLHNVIRIGDDTDTTAAIAGALVGARWGATAVPHHLRRNVRGWPGKDAATILRDAASAARGGDDESGWPSRDNMLGYYLQRWPQTPYKVTCPYDDGLTLGNVSALDQPGLVDADAIVSLCRVGTGQRRDEHVEVWLVDTADVTVNDNLGFVVDDAAATVAALRDAGRTVFLHCVHGASRTPTVAARYLSRHRGVSVEAALTALGEALPVCVPNPTFAALLRSS